MSHSGFGAPAHAASPFPGPEEPRNEDLTPSPLPPLLAPWGVASDAAEAALDADPGMAASPPFLLAAAAGAIASADVSAPASGAAGCEMANERSGPESSTPPALATPALAPAAAAGIAAVLSAPRVSPEEALAALAAAVGLPIDTQITDVLLSATRMLRAQDAELRTLRARLADAEQHTEAQRKRVRRAHSPSRPPAKPPSPPQHQELLAGPVAAAAAAASAAAACAPSSSSAAAAAPGKTGSSRRRWLGRELSSNEVEGPPIIVESRIKLRIGIPMPDAFEGKGHVLELWRCPLPLAILALDTSLLYANEAAQRFFGYGDEDIRAGVTAISCVQPENMLATFELLGKLSSGETDSVFLLNEPTLNKEKQLAHFHTTATPLRDEAGDVRALLLIMFPHGHPRYLSVLSHAKLAVP
jgi:PAS domain-containing protein